MESGSEILFFCIQNGTSAGFFFKSLTNFYTSVISGDIWSLPGGDHGGAGQSGSRDSGHHDYLPPGLCHTGRQVIAATMTTYHPDYATLAAR